MLQYLFVPILIKYHTYKTWSLHLYEFWKEYNTIRTVCSKVSKN